MMSITQLRNGCMTLADRCVSGITANADRMRQTVEHSIGLVTAISPAIGYEQATYVAKRALATGQSVREVVLGEGIMTEDAFEQILGDVEKLTGI
jgi:aspartate ammonia-lyase